jgi:FMN phosphatase YigB (HAD superfamily)/DNA-binding Xre family transcriptional regulator
MPTLDTAALKHKRLEAGLTQKELARRSGVSYSTLTKLEQGTTSSPSVSVIADLATVLGCDSAEVLEVSEYDITPNPDIWFVYFDVGGVLVHWLPSLEAFAERINRPENTVKAVFHQFNDTVCRGNMTMEELQLLILLRLQVPLKGKARDEALQRTTWMEDMRPITPTHNFLRSVMEHYKVGLLTNVFREYYPGFFQQGLVPNLSYQTLIRSYEVGYVKPEQEIYQIAEQAAGTPPERILFIDDSRVNVNAARERGWQAEWFDEYAPRASIQRIIREYFSGTDSETDPELNSG